MPRKHDAPSAESIADIRKQPVDYQAAAVARNRVAIEGALQKLQERDEAITKAIRRVLPDYDGSDRSLCKLAGVLSKHYPGEPLSDWHELPAGELLGYIDAIADERAKPQSIPADKRTKPMSKKEALNFIGWPSHAENARQAVDWLAQSIRDGEYRWEEINSKKGVYHIDDFPPECHKEIRKV